MQDECDFAQLVSHSEKNPNRAYHTCRTHNTFARWVDEGEPKCSKVFKEPFRGGGNNRSTHGAPNAGAGSAPLNQDHEAALLMIARTVESIDAFQQAANGDQTKVIKLLESLRDDAFVQHAAIQEKLNDVLAACAGGKPVGALGSKRSRGE